MPDGSAQDNAKGVENENTEGGIVMLTLEDCIDLCGLTEDEILAIAEHENLDEMAAVALGNYLVQTPDGERRIRKMIVEDIRAARQHDDTKHAAMLKLVLKHYVEAHHLV